MRWRGSKKFQYDCKKVSTETVVEEVFRDFAKVKVGIPDCKSTPKNPAIIRKIY